MSLKEISKENLQEEKEIQIKINNNIDQFKSIIFSSGAGSGKTYALKESLKHIVINHGKQLRHNNQNIICITYTNVATQEIRERLGNSKLVKVSTIHERIWDLIKKYQKELVLIHKENLTSRIEEVESKLSEGRDYSKYYRLNDDQQEQFKSIILKNKDLYYSCVDRSADDIRNVCVR